MKTFKKMKKMTEYKYLFQNIIKLRIKEFAEKNMMEL